MKLKRTKLEKYGGRRFIAHAIIKSWGTILLNPANPLDGKKRKCLILLYGVERIGPAKIFGIQVPAMYLAVHGFICRSHGFIKLRESIHDTQKEAEIAIAKWADADAAKRKKRQLGGGK